MTPEQMERAIEFLLNNQADQDVRFGKLEKIVGELTQSHGELAQNLVTLTDNTGELAQNQREIQIEFREGFERLIAISEETQKAVKDVLELEARTFGRVKSLENRVDSLEERVDKVE